MVQSHKVRPQWKAFMSDLYLEMGVLSILLNDCNWTRTHNHLVRKLSLNHLAKLAK